MGLPTEKRSLRDYLTGFERAEPEMLEKNANEIMGHVRAIMEPYARGEHGIMLQRYYAPALTLFERAYEKKDFKGAFPEAIDFMISSVTFE